MSDKELDEILNEIKMRNNSANAEDKPIDNNTDDFSADKIAEDDRADKKAEVADKSSQFKFESLPKQEKTGQKEFHSIIQEDIKELKEKSISSNDKKDVLNNAKKDIANDIESIKVEDKAEADDVAAEEANDVFNITSEDVLTEENVEEPPIDIMEETTKKDNSLKKKGIIIAVIAIVVAVAVGLGLYFGYFNKNKEPETTINSPTTQEATEPVAEPTAPLNPLTGEAGYSESALNQRPVAVVVENEYSTESVRPQWGLADADIVLEGESEFSTRLLLFWADYTKVPAMVGPTRSARPPFIRFSQLFDSVFIHAGLSHSKDNYEGADTVFKNENVDHINGLADSMSGKYFGRSYNRTSTVEHTAYLNGENLPELLKNHKINTELNTNKFTALSFNEEAQPLSDTKAEEVSFNWSDVYSSGKCPKTAKFTFDSDSKKYVTTDFDSRYGKSNVNFENLIFLLDETEYIVKQNYKGKGKSETYCNYKLSGGKGTVLSQGTAVEITWGVTNSKLWMKTADGKDLVLNPGKIYIGYGSSNHGGAVKLNPSNENNN